MIRKPTIFVFFVVLGFIGVYLYSRHDLVEACPGFFKEPIKEYAPRAGMDDFDDGQTFESCTNQDSIYLDMEQWAFYAKMSGVLCGLLFLADIASFSLARSHHRDDFAVRRGQLVVQRRKILHKISRFLGGL